MDDTLTTEHMFSAKLFSVSLFNSYSISLKDLALSGFFSAFVFFGAELYRIVKRPNALLSVRMKCPNAKWVDVRRP